MAEQLKPIYIAPEVHRALKLDAMSRGIKLQKAAAEAVALWLAANKIEALKARKGNR